MILFQYRKRYGLHAIIITLDFPLLFFMFQYRKRYGLHAMTSAVKMASLFRRFNTASGMDCMQYVAEVLPHGGLVPFQYRKRYGLHAIRHRRGHRSS